MATICVFLVGIGVCWLSVVVGNTALGGTLIHGCLAIGGLGLMFIAFAIESERQE